MKESLINKLNKLKNYFLIKENLNKNFKNIYHDVDQRQVSKTLAELTTFHLATSTCAW